MNKPTQIRRNLMLKELDIKFDPKGNRMVFSLKFCTDEGKLYFFPRAIATGLRMNMKEQRRRGIQPVDCKGNFEGHVYPVNIDAIIEYNAMKVIL